MREIKQRLDPKCPFCRHPAPKSMEDSDKNLMKRVEANDPVAMRRMGKRRHEEGDYNSAFEYYTKAAGFGDVTAHYNLSIMYLHGEGVEKDKKKELHHLEQAAIGGHSLARYTLGVSEWNNGMHERAVKHFIIAANLGEDNSLKELKQCFKKGDIRKEIFAAALRAHQAAVDATKSPQRNIEY